MRARRALALCAALVVAVTAAFAGGKGRSDSGSVYVKPYVTKSGKYVEGHYRSAPNDSKADNYSSPGSGSKSRSGTLGNSYSVKPSMPARSYSAPRAPSYASGGFVSRDPKTGRIVRSEAAKKQFQKSSPCPSTGRKTGPCPGYEIDHTNPLKCGGADLPSNMQWLSEQAHAMKTAREASSCRR